MLVDLYVNCNRTKLVALLQVLQHKDAYGPIKDWTAATVAEVGVIIGKQKKVRL
jgi:hypothetical protein